MQKVLANFELMAALAIVALLLSLIIALRPKYKKQLAYQIRIIGIGIIVAIAILFLPFSNGDPIYSILTAIQAGAAGAGYDELMPRVLNINNPEHSGFDFAYRLFLQILMLIAPVFIGGIIIGFSHTLRTKLAYNLKKHAAEIICFSELNNHALTLAQTLLAERAAASATTKGRPLIVFCNFKPENTEPDLIKAARNHGFILLASGEYAQVNRSHGALSFFEISQNADLNLVGAKKIIDYYQPLTKASPKIAIYLFTDQPEAEIIINSLDKKGITVLIIDKPVRLAYDLMFNQPLYQALTKNNKISALIVGGGNLGTEMIKAIAWCGQLGSDYSLEIKVVDANAKHIAKTFALNYPELSHYSCPITFYEADITTIDFENILNQHGQDINYIVICLGAKEQGLKTALYLREYYLRQDLQFANLPLIHTFISNSIKYSYIPELKAQNKKGYLNYQIYPFGETKSFYSQTKIINSPIEKLAQNGQAFYSGSFIDEPDYQCYRRQIIDSYNQNEINKRSNRANIIHIKYKLFLLGYQMQPVLAPLTEPQKEQAALNLKAVKEKLANPVILEKLAIIEHQRWAAFQTAEGYRGADIEQAQAYAKQSGDHKNTMAKLHACICPWQQLDAVSAAFNQDFKAYDKGFVEAMLKIIGAEQDPLININDCQYILLKN